MGKDARCCIHAFQNWRVARVILPPRHWPGLHYKVSDPKSRIGVQLIRDDFKT